MDVREELTKLEWPDDSLSRLDMLMEIEDEFDILYPDSTYEEVKTLEDLIVLTERLVNESVK